MAGISGPIRCEDNTAERKKVLILIAHPNVHGKSLSHALANTAEETLIQYGDEVRKVDLFQIKFGLGGREDFKEVLYDKEAFDYQWEQRSSAEKNMDNFSEAVREQVEHLIWADVVISVFPFYWFYCPAVLKAWQDRVFVWHLFYGGGKNLAGKRFLTVTTCGASEDIYKNVFKTSVEDLLKGFSVAPAALMGATVVPTYVVYGAHGVPEEKEKRHNNFCADFKEYLEAHHTLTGHTPGMISTTFPIKRLTMVPNEKELKEAALTQTKSQIKKKNILILLAHNNFNANSLNHAFAKKAAEVCKEVGHEVRFVDLNEINFGIGGVDDFKTSFYDANDFDYQWEQRATAEKDPNNFMPELAEQIDNLKWADVVMFQFPLYWFHMPAIMKAWIDRVLVWHLFYGAGKSLEGKSFFLSTTLGATPELLEGHLNTSVPDLLKGINDVATQLLKAESLPMYANFASHGPPEEKDARHPPFVAAFEKHFRAHII